MVRQVLSSNIHHVNLAEMAYLSGSATYICMTKLKIFYTVEANEIFHPIVNSYFPPYAARMIYDTHESSYLRTKGLCKDTMIIF